MVAASPASNTVRTASSWASDHAPLTVAGETKDQQAARAVAATHMILGFFPRDVIEAMLAGRCVMFHELIVDSLRDTLRGEVDTSLRPAAYWRLWLFDTALVSAGILFFLATQYGTYEFFGRACAMALLPFIPVSVLVGGAGSTIFALTKVWIEKRALNRDPYLKRSRSRA